MIEQILLRSGSFDGVREIGGFGQPLHALYPQIRAVLAGELEAEAAGLLAEPVVDRAKNRIDWYTRGDPDHRPVALSELPDERRRPILAQIGEFIARGREVAQRYADSGDPRRARLGEILGAALAMPAEADVYLVEGKPVIAGWGFAPDRPWEMPGGAARGPITPAKPVESGRDAMIPEVAIPEITAGSEPAALARSPVETGQAAESSPPLPEPAIGSSSLAEPAATAPEDPAPLRAESELPHRPEAASLASVTEPPPASKSSDTSPLRYVVVGSRYFWGVVFIALLVLLVAAYWGLGRERTSHPVIGQAARAPTDAKIDEALARSRRQEAELRARLEQLLVELAGRRGQCPMTASGSVGAGTAGIAPIPGESAVTGTILAQPSDRVAVSPPTRADRDEGESLTPVPPGATSDAVLAPSGIPGRASGQRVEIAPDSSAVTERPIAPPSFQASPAGDESPLVMPSAQTPPVGVEKPSDAVTRPPAPVPPAPSDSILTARSLEEALTGRDPQPGPAARTPAPADPPIKAQLTPEERREFADRMSATGATTGEITATLRWNGPSDLDLVVRCPSGRQLDYRNPAECGGTLDVDANTARSSLSERPMENAFWPAGKAGPGRYEISVRYIPRKDEERPKEAPFQVRLIQNGRESGFKGTIRPNATVPVTTFDVRR